MKSELFLSAMDQIDPEYLTMSENRPAKRRSPLKLILIAAAAVCCLALAVTAATHGNFRTERVDGDRYEISFAHEPAEDAPWTLEKFYLPEVLEGYTPAASSSLRDWTVCLDWHGADGGQIQFQQTALATVQGMPFVNMGGLDLNEMEQGVRTVDGTEVLILSAKSEVGSAEWMYWVDAENHYVFSLFCNETVSGEQQLAIFRSIREADKNDFRTFAEADGYDTFFAE